MPEDGFRDVADADDLWDGEMEPRELDGREILLIRLGGRYHAYGGLCPHSGTPLADGRLDGTSLICGAHEWEFDARTGAGINPAAACLKRYEVRVDGGRVLVSPTATGKAG